MFVDSMGDVYVLRAAKIGVAPIPPGLPLPRKLEQGPKAHLHLSPIIRTFKVVYESKGLQ